MKRPIGILLVAALAIALINTTVAVKPAGAASAEPEGLLLGLRSQPDPKERPQYSTYFIVWENDKIRVVEPSWPGIFKEGRGLMVARNTGFWQVDAVRVTYSEFDDEYIVAGPVGKEVKLSVPVAYDGIEYRDSTSEILFVSGKYVAVKEWNAMYGHGAMHPIAMNGLRVYSLDDLSAPLSINKVLGAEVLPAFNRGAATYYAASRREGLANEANVLNWAVERGSGEWVLKGLLGYTFEVYKEVYGIFDVPFRAPSSLVEYDALQPPWRVIKTKLPHALDAFSSPRGNLLVVLVPGKLLFYSRPSEDSLGALSGQREIAQSSRAVVTQWAVGSYVEKWKDAFLVHFFGDVEREPMN